MPAREIGSSRALRIWRIAKVSKMGPANRNFRIEPCSVETSLQVSADRESVPATAGCMRIGKAGMAAKRKSAKPAIMYQRPTSVSLTAETYRQSEGAAQMAGRRSSCSCHAVLLSECIGPSGGNMPSKVGREPVSAS